MGHVDEQPLPILSLGQMTNLSRKNVLVHMLLQIMQDRLPGGSCREADIQHIGVAPDVNLTAVVIGGKEHAAFRIVQAADMRLDLLRHHAPAVVRFAELRAHGLHFAARAPEQQGLHHQAAGLGDGVRKAIGRMRPRRIGIHQSVRVRGDYQQPLRQRVIPLRKKLLPLRMIDFFH